MGNDYRIALVSTHDSKGGAARATLRLHRGLLDLGCDSTLFCRWKHSTEQGVVGLYDGATPWERALTSANSYRLRRPVAKHQLGRNCDMFSLPVGPCRRLPPELLGADVINLHWTSSMIDLSSFFQLIDPKARVFWTLHDMNLFTGGCHYSGPCRKYEIECDSCPELNSKSSFDLSSKAFYQKKEILSDLSHDRLTIVAPSQWLADCARCSELLRRFPVRHVPYGVDTKLFRPIEQQQARRALGIESDQRVLLFVSDQLQNHRKGFDLLLESLVHLSHHPSTTLLAIGACERSETLHPPEMKYRSLGFLQNQTDIARAYSAADVFVIPSRQDNLPNTVLESLACGTPVAGYAVGGIPDLVLDGETGFCAEPESPRALAEAIEKTLESSSQMRRRCRSLITEHYSLSQQAERYREIFEESLAS